MDVLIFGGQSNMQGQTEILPPDNEPVKNILEYRHKTHSLQPLVHPVGEDLEDLLLAAHEGHGSLLPDFCKAYQKECGNNVVAVHVAKGATCLSDWLSGTRRFEQTLEKIQEAFALAEKQERVENIFFIWLQGESDALAKTEKNIYLRQLIEFKNSLKRKIDIKRFCIIRVGFFSQEKVYDRAIMRAQEMAAKTDKDFCILTRICSKLSRRKKYLNPYAAGHFNNEGMHVIGCKAGKNLGKSAVRVRRT